VTFGSVDSSGEAAPQAEGSPNLLWGTAAAGLIGAVTAVVLDERRKRKEEEARQLAEAQAKAAALNAAEEQKRVENYLNGKASLEEQLSHLRNRGVPTSEIERIQEIASKSGLAAAISEANDQISELGRINSIGQLTAIEEVEERYQDQYREVTNKPGSLTGPYIESGSTNSQSVWEQISENINLRLVDPVVNYFEGLYYAIINPPDDRGNLFRFSSNETDPTLPYILSNTYTLFTGIFQNEIHYDKFLDAHPAIHTTINVVNNVVSFVGGFSLQILDDVTFGLLSTFLQLDNGGTSFQYGRQAGRAITTFASIAELIGGAITAIIGFGSIPPTAGIGTACTVATGGACVVVLGVAIPLELAFGLAGTAMVLHGGLMLAGITNNPVPTARDLDSTLSYGSNTGRTSSNSRLLRNSLRSNRINPGTGQIAHHLVASTSQNPFARAAREILQRFDIDINNYVNGVFLDRVVHNHIHTNDYYFAVYEALSRCSSQEQVIVVLQDIAEQLSILGYYP